MAFLPEGASFEERVQDCFVTYRGAGLMLSALDVQLAEEWGRTGVPFEVVERGIQRAVERAMWDARPGAPPIRTLRACKRQVEAEIEKHRARSVGEGVSGVPVAGLVGERHRKLLAALRKIGREHPALEAAVARLEAGALREVPAGLDGTQAQEDRAMATLLRALPYADRAEVLKEARAVRGHAQPLSGPARRQARRFHNWAALRKRLSFPPFW